MVDEKTLLSQCIDLANHVIKKNINASISIKIGECFTFEFDNHNAKEKNVKNKSPCQVKRDIERCKTFKKKYVNSENNEEKVNVATSTEEIKIEQNVEDLEFDDICEKVFIVPMEIIEKQNKDIEQDVTAKLEAKGIKVRKFFIKRAGNPLHGEYIRSIVLIEPAPKKMIDEDNFAIKKCWVLRE